MRTVIPKVKLKRNQKVAQISPISRLFPLTTKVFLSSAQRQRLVSVQSILSRPARAQASRSGSSTELELHQRQLFEYFLVVSLQKPKAGGHYLPEVTQQFPLKVKSSTPPLDRFDRNQSLFIIRSWSGASSS